MSLSLPDQCSACVGGGRGARGLEELNQPLVIHQHWPDPQPGPQNAIIRVEANGICRSDWHLWVGDWAWSLTLSLPRVMGREYYGVVEEVGPQVTQFTPGIGWCAPFTSAAASVSTVALASTRSVHMWDPPASCTVPKLALAQSLGARHVVNAAFVSTPVSYTRMRHAGYGRQPGDVKESGDDVEVAEFAPRCTYTPSRPMTF